MRNNRTGTLSGTKIVTLVRLKSVVASLKRAGRKVVFTNGCFDILHYGHVKYLQDARAKGDCLVVAVNSDASVRKIKGKDRPVVGQSDRARTLAALACVDFVVLFNQPDPLSVIKTLKPDYLVKGSDWSSKNIIGADFVKERGGKVLTVKLVPGRSTTALIKKIVKVFS